MLDISDRKCMSRGTFPVAGPHYVPVVRSYSCNLNQGGGGCVVRIPQRRGEAVRGVIAVERAEGLETSGT